jgi:restriction system protein
VVVIAILRWIAERPWIILVALLVGGGVVGARWYLRHQQREWDRVRARGLRYELTMMDSLHHSQFEDAVRDLMFRDGCRDARRVGGAGDQGADVIATDPFGRRWVIQCKHRRQGAQGSPVGGHDMQTLNGTARPVHGADIPVMLTNGRVTKPAWTFAQTHGLYVVDRNALAMWAAGQSPLWEVLRVQPPRKLAS